MEFGNPILRRLASQDTVRDAEAASYNGITFKLGAALLALLVAFGYTWHEALSGEPIGGLAMVGTIGGLILGLIIVFARWANAFSVSVYAACQGLFLGAISAIFEVRYPGIVMQASLATIGTFVAVYALYSTGILKASPGFMRFLSVAVLGIGLVYLVDLVSRLFGHALPLLSGNGPLSIGISCVIVVVAALSLVADFACAQEAVEGGAPVQFEWQIVFGLIVGLVWLYIEILRLLAKLRGRDRD